MTVRTKTQLQALAQGVRDAVARHSNTPARVGGLMEDMVDSMPGLGVVHDITGAPYSASPSAPGVINSAALQAAMTAASSSMGRVLVPPGTYMLSQRVSLPDGAFLELELQAGAILDFSQLTTLPAREACITVGTHNVTENGPDGVTALPTLASSATLGASTVALASAPSLSPGDVFFIVDKDSYSWNANLNGAGGHNDRPYYHTGEQCRVHSVSGAVVTLEQPLRDSYTAGSDIELYRVTRSTVKIWGGGKIICPGLAALDVGIHVTNGRGFISDIELTGARWAALELWRCKGLDVVGVRAATYSPAGDEGAGLYMISCEDCWVRGGHLLSGKHGMSLTGGAIFRATPNRRCGAIGATLVGTLTAADMHGHCEGCSYEDCEIDGGASLGGQNVKLSGGSVRSASDRHAVGVLKGTLVRMREVRGQTFTVENVKFVLSHLSVQGGADFPISLDTFDAIGTGIAILKDCSIRAEVYNAKLVYLSAWPGSGGEFSFVVEGFDYAVVAGQKAPQLIIEGLDTGGTAAFREVLLSSIRGVSPTPSNVRARRSLYQSIDVSLSDGSGILAAVVAYAGVTQFIDVLDCAASDNDATGIFVSGGAAANDVYATVRGCRSLNNGQDSGVSAASKSSLRAENIKSIELSGNTWGDTQGSPTQGILYSVTSTTTLIGSGNKSIGAALLRSVSVTNDREELTFVGTGTPEGAVTAPVGSMFIRTDGGAATSRYFKESGTGNTGWAGK